MALDQPVHYIKSLETVEQGIRSLYSLFQTEKNRFNIIDEQVHAHLRIRFTVFALQPQEAELVAAAKGAFDWATVLCAALHFVSVEDIETAADLIVEGLVRSYIEGGALQADLQYHSFIMESLDEKLQASNIPNETLQDAIRRSLLSYTGLTTKYSSHGKTKLLRLASVEKQVMDGLEHGYLAYDYAAVDSKYNQVSFDASTREFSWVTPKAKIFVTLPSSLRPFAYCDNSFKGYLCGSGIELTIDKQRNKNTAWREERRLSWRSGTDLSLEKVIYKYPSEEWLKVLSILYPETVTAFQVEVMRGVVLHVGCLREKEEQAIELIQSLLNTMKIQE